MTEKYVSERLLDELPRPLINFLWYLWEVYCDTDANESLLVLQPGEIGQRIIIPNADKTVEQDFGTKVEATITIQKIGLKYFMSRR